MNNLLRVSSVLFLRCRGRGAPYTENFWKNSLVFFNSEMQKLIVTLVLESILTVERKNIQKWGVILAA